MEEHFFPNENINKALNLFTQGTTNATVRKILLAELEQDLSYMAIDRSNNNLVGAIVCCKVSPDSKQEIGNLVKQLVAAEPKWNAYVALQQKSYPESLFDICGTNSVFELHQLTLLPAYQGKKLAKPLVHAAHELGWKRGFQVQHALATAEASRALLVPLGFRNIFPILVFFDARLRRLLIK